MKHLYLLPLLAALTAHAAEERLPYACDNGSRIDISFSTDADGRPQATLHFADEALILPQVPTASGTLYRRGEIRLRSQGDNALFEDGKGNLRRCTRGTTPPASNPPAPAAASSFIQIGGSVSYLAHATLPPDARRRTEIAFLLALGGFIVEGRIDLFVETRDEVIVVDFKSDAEQDASHHRAQLSLYRRAAAGLAPGKRVIVGLYWLRTGEIEWQAEDLSEATLLDLARRAAEALDNSSA